MIHICRGHWELWSLGESPCAQHNFTAMDERAIRVWGTAGSLHHSTFNSDFICSLYHNSGIYHALFTVFHSYFRWAWVFFNFIFSELMYLVSVYPFFNWLCILYESLAGLKMSRKEYLLDFSYVCVALFSWIPQKKGMLTLSVLFVLIICTLKKFMGSINTILFYELLDSIFLIQIWTLVLVREETSCNFYDF